ncbi:MAG: hypothetical protein JJU41_13665 [Bacteroidetes bacterium]|nr:hypothetical protein [Bacteroidota bacterium]
MPKVKIKRSFLEEPKNVQNFVDILGVMKYQDTLNRFALAYGGTGKFAGYTPEEIGKMSPEAYEKNRENILADMSKVAPRSQDVELEIEVSADEFTTPQARERFSEVFGHSAYMTALGLNGLEDASLVTLSKLNDNIKIDR